MSEEPAIDEIHIFVAGYDYSNRNSPTSFLKISRSRAAQIISQSKGRVIGIVYFDFGGGMASLEVTTQSHKSNGPLIKPLGAFEAADAKHYRPFYLNGDPHYNAFNGSFPEVLSIQDVYDFIKSCAKRFGPNKLMSLNILSHAYYDGPILLNSYDGLRVKIVDGKRTASWPSNLSRSGQRDPQDKDARMLKDFRPPNFSIEEKAAAKRSLNEDFYSWIWGCNYSEDAQIIFDKMNQLPNKFQLTGIHDEKEFTFFFGRALASRLYSESGTGNFFPQDIKQLSFKRSLIQIKKYHLGMTRATYANELASFLDKPVYAALPGTEASVSKSPMQIRRTARSLALMRFYRNYLKAQFDKEGLGYARYPLPET